LVSLKLDIRRFGIKQEDFVDHFLKKSNFFLDSNKLICFDNLDDSFDKNFLSKNRYRKNAREEYLVQGRNKNCLQKFK